jgi:SnoaL-like domain
MPDDAFFLEAIEKFRVQDVIVKAVVARDSGHWEALAECYHPDATIATSWFTGTPAEFVKGSQDMKIARHEGESQKHMTGNYLVDLNGDRAVGECDLILYQRRVVTDVELDFSTWSRRLHLMEKRNREWRIRSQTVIYEKDRMDPAHPDKMPQGFYSSMDLSKYPSQIRYHCWRNDMVGFPPPKNICLKGTDREKEVREAARKWIAGE